MAVSTKTRFQQILDLGLFTEVWYSYKANNFPISIRMHFDPYSWLEYHVDKLQKTADPGNPDDVHYFEKFMTSFLHEVQVTAENKIASTALNGDTSQRHIGLELQAEVTNLITREYERKPVELFRTLVNCMNSEKAILQQKVGTELPPQDEIDTQPQEQLRILSSYSVLHNKLYFFGQGQGQFGEIQNTRQRIKDNIHGIFSLRQELGQLSDRIYELTQQPNGVVNTELSILQTEWTFKNNKCIELTGQLPTLVTAFITAINGALSQLKLFGNEAIAFLEEWKFEKRKEGNGFPVVHNIDKIEELFNIITSNLIEVGRECQISFNIGAFYADDPQMQQLYANEFYNIQTELEKMLYSLSANSFVVKQQPNQLLKLKSVLKQGIVLELLVGASMTPNSSFKVEAMLIDQEQVKSLQENPLHMPIPALKITNNETTLTKVANTCKFSAEFSCITLPAKRKDPEQKGKGTSKSGDDQLIPRKKYYFYFRTVFECKELKIHPFTIWALSTPVTVLCHDNQAAAAWATIFWHNGFLDESKEIDVNEFVENLSNVFKKDTRRGFSTTHKEFLVQKLKTMSNPTSTVVTWKKFFDDKLDCTESKKVHTEKVGKSKDELKVTFCLWIYTIKRMCENRRSNSDTSKDCVSVRQHWEGKLIEGFITRTRLEQRLSSGQNGTFMLYFSEAILGGLTVAWYDSSDGKINKFAPYESKELKEQSLEHRILSSSRLQYVYPNIPKEHAFKCLRDSRELTDVQWKLIQKGYVLLGQKQVEIQVPRDGHSSSRASNASYYSSTSTSSISNPTSGHDNTSQNVASPSSSTRSEAGSLGYQNIGNKLGDTLNFEADLYEILSSFET